jgi:DNA-binding transcriptional LysR family regulator
MDQLRGIRVFCAAVELGSLSAAADLLALSPPMASKHLAALEARLGARLLNRTTRRRSATAAGLAYYTQCREALNLLDAAERQTLASAKTPRGVLRVSAPTWLVGTEIGHLLAEHRRRFPAVVLDIRFENELADLASEGFDVALRVTHDPTASLVARPLGGVAFIPVAAPELVMRSPRIETPSALDALPAVVPGGVPLQGLVMTHADGRCESVGVRSAMVLSQAGVIRDAVLAGAGYTFLPLPMVARDVASGRLIRLLPEWRSPSRPVLAVYLSQRQLAPKVRTFIDLLALRLPLIEGFESPARR